MEDTLIEEDAGDKKRTVPATVFVTGATGLVGSHLVRRLVAGGKLVKALYRHKKQGRFEHPHLQWVEGDILDLISLQDAMEGIEQVYHCAALVSYNPRQKEQLFLTNVEGTANVVNIALECQVKKLCYLSSVAALGQSKEAVTEQVKWSETTNGSNYGKSKFFAENEVWRGIGEGLDAVIVNPTIVLGEGNWEASSTKLFKSAFDEFPYYTQGITGFVDVEDLVTIMVALMESPFTGENFIVNGENRSYRDVFTLMARAFGKRPPYREATPLLSELVWRLEAVKRLFTAKDPLLTKETARHAQRKRYFDSSKLLSALPSFRYTPLEQTIVRVCAQLQNGKGHT